MLALSGSSWRRLAMSHSISGMTLFAKPVQQGILAMDQPLKRLVQAAIIVWVVVRTVGTK